MTSELITFDQSFLNNLKVAILVQQYWELELVTESQFKEVQMKPHFGDCVMLT